MAGTRAATAAPERGARRDWPAILVMLAIFAIAPFFVYPVFLMKALCFALFACAFNLLIGFGGLLSFGHAMFLGTAGYVSAHAAKVWGLTPEFAILAGTLAAVATLSSPIAVDAVVDRIRIRSRVPPILQLAARMDALVAVVAFGLVLAIFHRGDVAPGVRPPTPTEWAVINVAVGVASGVLFHLFLGPRGHLDEGRLFVALAGAIVVASGASYYLNLSPIFTNLVLGVILVNSGGAHRDVTRLLLSTERPVYLALLLFAGAAWSPGSVDLLFIAPLFVLIRVGARFLAWQVVRERPVPGLRAPRLGKGWRPSRPGIRRRMRGVR